MFIAATLRVNDWLHAPLPHSLKEVVGVVACVGDEGLAVGMREQRTCGDHFVPLAWRERDVERARLGVDEGVDFG